MALENDKKYLKTTCYVGGASIGKRAASRAMPGSLNIKNVSYEKISIAFGPAHSPAADGRLLAMARRGEPLAAMATATGLCGREIVVRLVELRLGPLGRQRPAPKRSSSQPFRGPADGNGPAAVRQRQAPVLRLAARVLGPGLQRLGDRVFLNGQEMDVPSIVRLARARGEPIHYPGIAPLEGAMAGGPSSHRLPGQGSMPLISGLRP